jgi:uncharacterized membrane protein/cbb3-type cytochrome oxidase subunit 3
MQKEQTASLCKGETVNAKVVLKNIARDEERVYAISATSKNANANVLTYSPKVTVGLNSEKAVDVAIDGSKMDVGVYDFAIKAQALYEATDVPTTDIGITNLKVEVKNCESFEIQAQDSIDVCAGTPSTYKIKLINKGSPADIKLSTDLNGATLVPTSGRLHIGETAEIDLAINSQQGNYIGKIIAKSDLKTVEKQLKINARQCLGAELKMDFDKVICSEYGAKNALSIKNREIPSEYTLSIIGIDDAKLSKNKISLGKFESQTVGFEIPKGAAVGSYSATISATSKDAKDSITKDISIEKCFDFRLTGPELELCPCEEAAIEYELINFGVKDDTYSLKSESDFVKLKENEVTIKSKEKAKLHATISTCNIESGKVNAIVNAKSSFGTEDKLKIDLTVKSKEDCYGIELKPSTTQIATECGIKATSVQVINRGTKESAVSLSATQGSKVTPDTLLLGAGDSKEVFLVVFPSPSRCGTTFNVDMKAESKGVAKTKQFSVNMAPEDKSKPTPTTAATPTTIVVKQLEASINYANDTLTVESLPGSNVMISTEGKPGIEEKTDENGKLKTKLGSGTFLITLTRAGYKPLTLQVNVTGNQTGIGGGAGSAGSLGSIPLLLIAFLIIVAALYFVLRRNNKETGDEEEETEDEEEEEKVKPKRGRKK